MTPKEMEDILRTLEGNYVRLSTIVDRLYIDVKGNMETVQDNFTDRLSILQEQIERRFGEAQRAIDKAAEQLDRRLVHLNELKEIMLAERGLYMTRELYDTKHRDVEHRMRNIEEFVANLTGRLWMLGVAFAAVTLVGNLLIRMLWR